LHCVRGPNWSFPFDISTKCFKYIHWRCIGIKGRVETLCHLLIISKNLTPTEKNYVATEKEFLVVVHAIKKFLHYITIYHIFVHIDHSSIRYLMNNPITNGRVTRWLFLL
jgi:hypothetical protein